MAEAEIVANYAGLEQLWGRLQSLGRSFSGIRQLTDVSAAGAGNGSLAQQYEEFRTAWSSNREEMLQELQAAAQVLEGALSTYRTADSDVAGETG